MRKSSRLGPIDVGGIIPAVAGRNPDKPVTEELDEP